MDGTASPSPSAAPSASTTAGAVVTEDGEEVPSKSPRLRAALRAQGVLWSQLKHKGIEHFEKDYAITVHPAIAQKRYEVHEGLRQKKLAQVLHCREQIVKGEYVNARATGAKSCPPVMGEPGGNSSLNQALDEASSMIQSQNEKKKKFFEAAQRRVEEDKQKEIDATKLSKQRTEEHYRILAEFEKRQRDQQMEVQVRRNAAEAHRHRREEKKVEEHRLANIEARRMEAERIRKGELLEAARKEREHEARQRGLAFARAHELKLQRIAVQLREKEARRMAGANETARKLELSEQHRVQKVAKLKAEVSKTNRIRMRKQKQRLLKKKENDLAKTQEIFSEFVERSEAVNLRLGEHERKMQQSIKVNRFKTEQAGWARQAKKVESEALAAGKIRAAMSGADSKGQAIREKQERRALQLQLRAEESRLRFMQRQDHVKCMQRVDQHIRQQKFEEVQQKDQKTEALLKAKRQMNDERRHNAMAFIVQKQKMDAGKKPLMATFSEKKDIARQIWPLAQPLPAPTSTMRFSLGGAF